MGALPIIKRRRRSAERGATLIELMAAVLIVGILTAFLVPSLSKIRDGADSAKCISNLRMIGAGIAGYVADHDGLLPGPLSGGTQMFYTPEDTLDPVKGGRLACFLQGYISKPAEGNGKLRSDVFVCPAYARKIKVGFVDKNQQCYVRSGLGIAGTSLKIFGTGSGTDNATPPQRLALASGNVMDYTGKVVPATQAVVLQDLDGDVDGWGPSSAEPKWFPDHPVHGSNNVVEHADSVPGTKQAHPGAYRNALFLDFHVARIGLDVKP